MRPSLQTAAIVLAWLVLIGLAAVTLVPIGLRPHSTFSPHVERFLAFAVAGLCLALAYPRRPVLTVVISRPRPLASKPPSSSLQPATQASPTSLPSSPEVARA